jgi:hypothetical protein
VIAAGPDEVAKNMDGLTTYVDLVSLLIEEKYDGLGRFGASPANTAPRLSVLHRR